MAPPIVRTINRYLLRQHLAPLAFALAALTSLMLIQQVAKQLSSLLGKGLPTGVIIEVFVLSLPFIVAVTLPMAVLVAVLQVFTRLAGDNEITAMQAGGLSLSRLVRPVLWGAAGVAVLSFLWNDQILPRTNHKLRTLQVDIQRKKPSLTLKEQVINEVVSGQFFLRAARIDGSSNKLKDVTLYDLGNAERRRIIIADSGRMAYPAGGPGPDPARPVYPVRTRHGAGRPVLPRPTAPRNVAAAASRAGSGAPTADAPTAGPARASTSEQRAAAISQDPAPAPAVCWTGAPAPASATGRLYHAGRWRRRGSTPARRARARGDVRGRDPEEIRDRRRVPRVRAARRPDRASLPAGRRGARDRVERRGVRGVLHRVDRGGRAWQPADRLSVFRDVDAQSPVRRGRPGGAVADPKAREFAARWGLERRRGRRAGGHPLAPLHAGRAATGSG